MAPTLAAIATDAASSAKRAVRACGAGASDFGSGRLNGMMAVGGSAIWAAGGSAGASILGSIFSILSSSFGSIFASAASILGAVSGISGFAASAIGAWSLAAIDGESFRTRTGSIFGLSSAMVSAPMGKIHPSVTTNAYQLVTARDRTASQPLALKVAVGPGVPVRW